MRAHLNERDVKLFHYNDCDLSLVERITPPYFTTTRVIISGLTMIMYRNGSVVNETMYSKR